MIVLSALPLLAYLFKVFNRRGVRWLPVITSLTIVILSYRNESFSLIGNLDFTFLLTGFFLGTIGAVYKDNVVSIKAGQVTFALIIFYLYQKGMITANALFLFFWLTIAFTQPQGERGQRWLLGTLPFIYVLFYLFENYFGISELSISSNNLSISNLRILKFYDSLRLVSIASIFLLPLKWMKDFASLGDFSSFWKVVISMALLLVIKKSMGDGVAEYNVLILFLSSVFLINYIFNGKSAISVLYGIGLIVEESAFLILLLLLLNSPSFAIKLKESFKSICNLTDLSFAGILIFVPIFSASNMSSEVRAVSLLLTILSIVTVIKKNGPEVVTA